MFTSFRARLVDHFSRNRVFLASLGLVATAVGYKSFQSIETGHVGFQSLFGNVSEHAYPSGFTFINPLANIIQLDLRKKVSNNRSSVASAEGLDIDVSVDVVYHLNSRLARDTYVNIGTDYANVLLTPQTHACIRDTIAGYEAKDLYNDQARASIKHQILCSLISSVNQNIIIEDVLINRIVLPNGLTRSIEAKLQAEQAMEKMEFTLAQEKKEAERKAIEAQGIKNFQDTVAQGISSQLLEWKGITATEELAKSPNAKMIFFGNANGLPVVFQPDNKA